MLFEKLADEHTDALILKIGLMILRKF